MTYAIRSTCYMALGLLSVLGYAVLSPGGVSLVDAFKGGKVDLYLRYRFEFVEDGQPRVNVGTPPTLSTVALQDAKASTLRTALGHSSGLFYRCGAYV